RKIEKVMNNIKRSYHEIRSDFIHETVEEYMAESDCPSCHGYRLKDEALSVLINGKHISALTEFSIVEAKEFFHTLELTKKENEIATMILKEINNRLLFLINVGLTYLTLSRTSGTLSGGEEQRIRLATQIR